MLLNIKDSAEHFNPRSHEGSDYFGKAVDVRTVSFQSTLPRRERLDRGEPLKDFLLFQSTLPRRERLYTNMYVVGAV